MWLVEHMLLEIHKTTGMTIKIRSVVESFNVSGAEAIS
jgi:uncharacterized protein YlxW (UPF0749 family)